MGSFSVERMKLRSINEDRGDRESFLRSYEWQTIRMRALTKYGPRCQCCGATPAHGAKIVVDHIKPRIRYPELALDINNLQILCAECNQGKANWDETDWRHQDQCVGVDDLDQQDAEHMRSIMRAR